MNETIMIPNDDGRDRRTLRSQKWRTPWCYVTANTRRAPPPLLSTQVERSGSPLPYLPSCDPCPYQARTRKMDITPVAKSTSSMKHGKHDKNGTGDDESEYSPTAALCTALSASATLQCTMVWYRKDLGQLAWPSMPQRHPTHTPSNSSTET